MGPRSVLLGVLVAAAVTCAAAVAALPTEVVSETATIPDRNSALIQLPCPESRPAVVGVGFEADGFDLNVGGAMAFPNIPLPGSSTGSIWVDAANPQGSPDVAHLTALAYCYGGPQLKGIREGVQLEDGETRSARAHCPRGRYAVSAGINGSGGGLVGVYFNLSRRTADGRGWRVRGTNVPDTGEHQKLLVIALCAKSKAASRIVERSASVVIPDLGSGIATADCPGSKPAISGGFKLGARGTGGPITSRRSADGNAWEVRANDFVAGTSSGLTAYAYCGSA